MSEWQCLARKQSLPEPADCDWPVCGCDPKADAVIEALQESGLIPEWRDISSAPKHPAKNWSRLGNSIILGFAPDETGYSLPSCEGHWRPAFPITASNSKAYSAGWVSSIDPHAEPPFLSPTHWQPLPKHPRKPPAVTSGTDAPGTPEAENQSPTVREGAGR